VALSLRTRLTVWYSALLLFAIVLFSATVLWLDWRLLVKQSDESLEAVTTTAINVVRAELIEGATLAEATHEMESVVRHPDYVVTVLDQTGTPMRQMPVSLPVPRGPAAEPPVASTRTIVGSDGRSWRLTLKTAESSGQRFTVAIAAPMTEIAEHWRALVDACALGIPFVLAFAAAGGWMLGRRGLRPLAEMAAQSREITASTPQAHLDVADAGAELEDVAASFNRVLDRLGTALATQRQFMADASHELRTPVSIMRTAADVTLSQLGRDESEYRDALCAVSQQSSRLARLVDDMLVLARADAGGYPMIRTEVDLDAVVGDCVRELAPRAAAKGIRVTSRLEPICVTADEALLRRMFGNLLSNALTYTPEGGAVDVTMASRQDAVAVHIADTGPGIAPDDRDRVFARFVRLDPARAEGGAGLGLSIARWIAEAHGGHVDLLTTGPRGSVFSATIPV
jgi:heavy metal sensor kinase